MEFGHNICVDKSLTDLFRLLGFSSKQSLKQKTIGLHPLFHVQNTLPVFCNIGWTHTHQFKSQHRFQKSTCNLRRSSLPLGFWILVSVPQLGKNRLECCKTPKTFRKLWHPELAFLKPSFAVASAKLWRGFVPT